jgi:hypothetical protein
LETGKSQTSCLGRRDGVAGLGELESGLDFCETYAPLLSSPLRKSLGCGGTTNVAIAFGCFWFKGLHGEVDKPY